MLSEQKRMNLHVRLMRRPVPFHVLAWFDCSVHLVRGRLSRHFGAPLPGRKGLGPGGLGQFSPGNFPFLRRGGGAFTTEGSPHTSRSDCLMGPPSNESGPRWPRFSVHTDNVATPSTERMTTDR